MRVNPFSDYLDNFPYSYRKPEIAWEALTESGFPIEPTILENGRTGLIPISYNGEDYYNVRELIGYARMYSIPNTGFIAKKPIRHTEILYLETEKNFINPHDFPLPENLKIKVVHIAAAFKTPKDEKSGIGQLVFICPFCGCIHYHGAVSKNFGDGNGHRAPHCTRVIPAFFRKDRQELGKYLDYSWEFSLVEVEDFRRAGDFPKYLAKNLANRNKG